MKQSIRRTTGALIPIVMISLVILTGFVVSRAENAGTSKVIFYVG